MPNRFRRELVLSGLIVIGSVVAFGVALHFLSGKIQAEAMDIASERLEIAKGATYLAGLADLKRSSQEAEKYQAAIEKLLVSQDRLIEFPGWLDGMARAHNVDLRFSFAGSEVETQADALGHIGFSIEATGVFSALTAFFKEVESQSQRFFVSMDTISITKSASIYIAASRGRVFFK